MQESCTTKEVTPDEWHDRAAMIYPVFCVKCGITRMAALGVCELCELQERMKKNKLYPSTATPEQADRFEKERDFTIKALEFLLESLLFSGRRKKARL